MSVPADPDDVNTCGGILRGGRLLRRVYIVVNYFGWPVARNMNYGLAAHYAHSWSLARPQSVFHVKHPPRGVVASFLNGQEVEPGTR